MDIYLKSYYNIFTFLLLVSIAEATDSNANETSHERRQSRVTGRIVKLYSGTRPEPILCAGEGFQADPHECAVFYRCMKSGNGKYTVFRFQCGPGTVYDPETEVCNHPRSTKRSECGGISLPPVVDRINNNEIEGAQHEIPSPIISRPIYNQPIQIESTTEAKVPTLISEKPWVAPSSTINTSTKRQISEVSTISGLYQWGSSIVYTDHTVNPLNSLQYTVTHQQQPEIPKTTSSPMTSAKPQINSRDNICTSDGFLGDTHDCRKFYRCVASQRGTFTRYEFSCSESTVWDDDTQSCNHAWAVKRSRCGRNSQQSNNISSSNTLFTNTNTEIPQKEGTYHKTSQQQLQISYGSKVTQTQTQISNGSVIQNQTQIHYGDRIKPNKDSRAKQNQTQISHGSAVSQTQTQIDYSDKGVQTQLQIDHSQQSSQTQIQIHDSTTKGTSTSTDSSANHVGAQDGNKCYKSGFMGDTNDCKKFYRCIDNGRGGYTKFEFSCGEGTVWDQSIEACNHAWAVKDCGGKGSSETSGTTQAAISTSISTQNYYPTLSTENYHTTTSELIDTEDNEDSGYGHPSQEPVTSSSTTIKTTTTVSSPTTTSNSKGDCQSSGFIGDSNDCKLFYRCVENGKGSFTKYEFKCGEGTVWDPDIEACNHAWAVKKCGGSASPDINKVETTTYGHTLPPIHTQSTIVTHSTTESVATQNDDYDTGYGSANNGFTSTTTTTSTEPPNNVDHITGSICQSNGFMGDDKDCKKFYRCVDNGQGGFIRYEFTCGEGTVWDSKIEACNHAWAVEKCGGSGTVIDHQEVTTQLNPTTSHGGIGSTTTESDRHTNSPIPSTTSSTSTITDSSTGSNVCTHSGFMGDTNDCKKFYRCVDNGNGSYTKYEFSCGEGTVWDQKIEACNHAWAVEKCGGVQSSNDHLETTTQYHPTWSDEIDNGYPSNVESGSDITTQSTTTLSTTERPKEPSEGNNCVNSGFIGDRNDCKKFYRCVDDSKGGFIRYEFSCGEGTLWDQSIEACNHAWAVKDCGQTGHEIIHIPGESTTHVSLTSESEDQGYPQYTEKTSTSTIGNYPDNQIGDTCYKEGFMGSKNDCKKFYRCVDNGRDGFTKYEFTCGEGTYWNQEILSCDHETSNKMCHVTESGTHIPQHDEMYSEATTISSTAVYENEYTTQRPHVSSGVCTSEGFYGDQSDCRKFYRCVDNGKGSYTKYDFTCGDGTVWDQEIQACNHAEINKNCSISTSFISSTTTGSQSDNSNDISVTSSTTAQYSTEKTESSSTSSSNQCTSEGFFSDPYDCKKFIRCVSNEKGGYTKYEFACGEGTIWVQDILACDHDTGDTNCSSQTTTKPFTTEGHQQTIENHETSPSTTEPQTIDKQEDEYDSGNSDKPSHSASGHCTSEGFHANENDCRQFYRCVDNGQGGYTKYDFTCGEGTAWDSNIQACNHIDQVTTCQGGTDKYPVMHDEENSQSTGSSTTMKTTTSETSHDTTSENKNTCDNEGYFGDTQDCKKFYRCVDNGKGGYTKYEFTCGEGTIWDQDVTTCNHPQDVVNPSCVQNQGGSATSTAGSPSTSSSESTISTTTTVTPSSGLSESTTSTTTTVAPSSSSSEGTTSTTERTESSSNCSQEETSKKPVNQNVTCTKAGYYANPNDCKKFYRCVDWDGDGKRFSVYHFECGEGTIWDPALDTCNHQESVYPPRDCSGSQSQSENQPPATEGTSTTQESTTTQKSPTTQSSTEQTTQSATSEQTTSQQSTTSEHTTTEESTTSQQPATQQSTTSEQTTTQQSTTSEQTTTEQSSSSEPTTQQSTTSEQTTQQSTTSEQTTTQEPTTSEKTTTQQSTSSEQTTQQSTTSEQTTTQQSTTSDQTTTQATTTSDQTTTQQSTTSEQTTTQQSTTSEQTTQESTTSEQTTTEQSTTSESITENSSTTAESTTSEQSTTQQPTTTEQSDQSTTEESSSEGSTTTEGTQQSSTTEQNNESSTTESATDQNSTESKCPETEENQSLFVCPTSFRRHPKYCNLFYQCDEDDDTHDVKIAVFTCPNNTIYDETQTRCVEESKADKKCNGKIAQKRRFKRLDKDYKEPIVVTSESHACRSAGYFSFEKDSECSPAFLKCKTDKSNKLRGLVYQCPTGYVYWSISKRCEPINRVRDCKRSHNNWTGRWEIPVERRNVAPS